MKTNKNYEAEIEAWKKLPVSKVIRVAVFRNRVIETSKVGKDAVLPWTVLYPENLVDLAFGC